MYIREYETNIGDALRPQLSLSFPQDCQKQMKGIRVAVVGGGMAGLMAARLLGQQGVNVTVYEARPQVGGRVLSNTTFSNGRITEEGAELIGSFHTTWLGLAKEYGLALISRMDPDLYERAGLRVKLRLDRDSTKDLPMVKINEIGKDMEVVLERIARDASQIRDESQPWLDPRLKAYDNMSVAHALETRYQVKRDSLLWKAFEFKLVNDEVAPLDQMNFLGLLCKVKGGQSVQFSNDDPQGRARLMRYWSELEIFRCADGCQTLAKKIAEEIQTKYGAKLRLSTAVTSIDIHTKKCAYTGPQKNSVAPNRPCVVLGSRKVISPDGSLSNQKPDFTPYHYVILATPPSVWKRVKITADGKPAQPADEIGLMGMNPAVKFFIDVKERFWINEKPPAAPYGGSLTLGQVWEGTDNQTRKVLVKVPNPRGGVLEVKQGVVLSVFAGPIIPFDPRHPRGPGRAPKQKECERELLKLYPDYKKNLTKAPLFSNWPEVPFIETGYASPQIGKLLEIGEKLSKSFHDLLFFAGEHTRMDFFGYMEGALRSGEDAAKKLMLQSCGLLKEPAPASPSPRVRTASAAPIRAKTAL